MITCVQPSLTTTATVSTSSPPTPQFKPSLPANRSAGFRACPTNQEAGTPGPIGQRGARQPRPAVRFQTPYRQRPRPFQKSLPPFAPDYGWRLVMWPGGGA
ncbi:hypothetical protein chiPu_0009671 [Chiloscyllium punctatum]|uniref:Uncharacterized protein n=1 Tax=Chiloscyllium punctatum TaxID=137246 RepID=A0A401SLE7_CHIPU|nr:hypothetical protein [Chiloscyllium punctatum]